MELQLTFDMLLELESYDKEVMDFILQKSKVTQLKGLLKQNNVKGYSKLKKNELIELVVESLHRHIPKKIETAAKKVDDVISGDAPKELDVPEEMKPIKIRPWDQSLEEVYFTGIWNEKMLKYRFRILSNILHPDKQGNSVEFDKMRGEYNVRLKLINVSRKEIRKVYDKKLADELNRYLLTHISFSTEYTDYHLQVLKKY